MEYTLGSYVGTGGKIFTSSDGFKYLKYKVKETREYLRCVLWKKGCKGTGKLNLESELIHPCSFHNHNIDEYETEVYDLKNRCKTIARNSQGSLRKLFDDETRTDPFASRISFNECESSMYRSRRKTQPKIPLSAEEFSEMLPGSTYGKTSSFRFLYIRKLQLYSTLKL